jgi:hypothetical protein
MTQEAKDFYELIDTVCKFYHLTRDYVRSLTMDELLSLINKLPSQN